MQSLKSIAGIKDGRMLGELRNNMITGRAPCQGYSTDSQVIAFRAAAGENKLAGGAT